MDNPIRRSAAPTSDVALIDLAGRLGRELPAAYRASLLAHNGGVPDRDGFTYTAKGEPKSAKLTWLFPGGRDALVQATANDLETAFA